jgi:uncharacterized heparinase superfamily protein
VLDGGGTHLVVRCGDVGQRGRGGHAHNDLLSYELSRARPLVLDSGNYAYTSDLEARNELRSTRAHNTVMVDGQEINPLLAGAAFPLPQVADPRVEAWEPTGDEPLLRASHDGYIRLEGVERHVRELRLDRRSGAVSVKDQIRGTGHHLVESFLHLAPDAEVQIEGAVALVDVGSEQVTITLEGSAELELAEGWISDSYGTRNRAPVLVARYDGELPALLGFCIEPADLASS